MPDRVRRFPDLETLAEAAAAHVARAARESAAARGRFLWVLSGGRTPLPLYRRLARRPDLPWDRTHVFWGDERWVPPGSHESNVGRARRALLDR
ncbi:MAG: 6-phosphogluconolactonase, partial [Candidatus Dadabacteria bacterium]